MYERMLDKTTRPSAEEMSAYCGTGLFASLNDWLRDECQTESAATFPYGNGYGWGIAHRVGKRLVCNVFPEKGAFTVMVRLSSERFAGLYDAVSPYARDYIDRKYPCGDGGWIHFRVLSGEHLADIETILSAKCGEK